MPAISALLSKKRLISGISFLVVALSLLIQDCQELIQGIHP
jgi:hypothetical protein